MPNDCVNHITITHPSELKEQLDAEMQTVHGTITQSGKNGIRFHCTTAWIPDYVWLETMTKKYPSCWIKDEWISEDGKAGVWIGYNNIIKRLEWDDLSIEDEYYMFN